MIWSLFPCIIGVLSFNCTLFISSERISFIRPLNGAKLVLAGHVNIVIGPPADAPALMAGVFGPLNPLETGVFPGFPKPSTTCPTSVNNRPKTLFPLFDNHYLDLQH